MSSREALSSQGLIPGGDAYRRPLASLPESRSDIATATIVTLHVEYRAFGATASQTNAINPGSPDCTGEYQDLTSGIAFAGHPMLPLTTGKWMHEDPVGFQAGDANLRRYVGNNATDQVDSTGLRQGPDSLSSSLAKAMTDAVAGVPGGTERLRALISLCKATGVSLAIVATAESVLIEVTARDEQVKASADFLMSGAVSHLFIDMLAHPSRADKSVMILLVGTSGDAKGAKSLLEQEKHVRGLKEALGVLDELKRKLAEASGKKAKEALEDEIDTLVNSKKGIKGHIKEIEQKWPGTIAKEFGNIKL